MKAYLLSIKDEEDAGQEVVFANTVKEARKQILGKDLYDSADGEWIRVQAHRDKRYDGMEGLDAAHLALEQWHDGWIWFDLDAPDPDTASDDEFIAWHKAMFAPHEALSSVGGSDGKE